MINPKIINVVFANGFEPLTTCMNCGAFNTKAIQLEDGPLGDCAVILCVDCLREAAKLLEDSLVKDAR